MLVLSSLLANPNVVYVLLFIGLWATSAAVYVPGTGFLEVAAVLCLVLAVAGLAKLPVNTVGLILIVVAGLLFVISLKTQSVAATVGAATSLVLGSVLLFAPANANASGPALTKGGPADAVRNSRPLARMRDDYPKRPVM